MKPHEQEWKVEQESPSHQPYVSGPDGHVATIQVRYKSDGKYAKPQMGTVRAEADFVAAAPDMARALLAIANAKSDEVVAHGETYIRLWLPIPKGQAMVAALKRAGVLP